MTKESKQPASSNQNNQMLGTQLIGKSIAGSRLPAGTTTTTSGRQQVLASIASGRSASTPKSNGQTSPRSTTTTSSTGSPTRKSPPSSCMPSRPSESSNGTADKKKSAAPTGPKPSPPPPSAKEQRQGSPEKSTSQKDGPPASSAKLESVLCRTHEAHSQELEHRALEAEKTNEQQQYLSSGSNHHQATSTSSNGGCGGLSAKDLELLAKEAQDLKSKTRKLMLEIEEKNEIINVLKDELETLREQSDKFQRENIQLVKDAKRVKFLQDENDFLQDKVHQVEKLELEIKHLKLKLQEAEFARIRVRELEEDLTEAREQGQQFEENLKRAEAKLARLPELEAELNKWKSFSHELELEKNSIQAKLLESIDHEAKLDLVNKKVEDEVRRLRDLIRSYEEQRDEEQASNSFVMSVADLKQLDEQEQTTAATTKSITGPPLVDRATSPAACGPASLQERAQQTDVSDTAEKSCATEASSSPDREVEKLAEAHERELLDRENRKLREELERREAKLGELDASRAGIATELEGNRKLISDLRQDLACEKSLTAKLTSQLSIFERQIKILDKQYFPMHDTSSSSSGGASKTTKNLSAVGERPPAAAKPEPSSRPESVTTASVPRSEQFGSGEIERAATNSLAKKGAIELRREGSFVGPAPKATSDNGKSGTADNETSSSSSSSSPSRRKLAGSQELKETSEGTKLRQKHNNSNNNNNSDSTTSRESPNGAGPSGAATSGGQGDSPNANDDLLKIAVGHQRQRTGPGSLILSNKSDAAAAAESGGQTKLLSTDADREITANSAAGLAPGGTGGGPVGHSRCATTMRETETLLSRPMIDGKGAAAADSKRKHANESVEQAGLKKNNIIKVPNESPPIHQAVATQTPATANTNTKRVGGGSTSSSLSPASSARSQSSSPPSVAATLSHDSGFQSINHDHFGPSLAEPSKGWRLASATPGGGPRTTNDQDRAAERQIDSAQNKQQQQQVAAADRSGRAAGEDADRRQRRESNRCTAQTGSDEEESDELDEELGPRPSAGKAARAGQRTSNFVRNSLPSRSVNFGHSKSSAYLDKIRASVSATTTTTSSHNHSAMSFVSNQQQQQPDASMRTDGQPARSQQQPHGFVLNCMLDHQHSERCFARIERPTHVHASLPVPGLYAAHPQARLQSGLVVPAHPHQAHPQHLAHHQEGGAPSRQLSALIDPAAHEQLLVGMLQQQQQANGLPAHLTEQQIAQLNNLHRQHYYHHLHQLHQMHHLHHLHHLQQQHHHQQQHQHHKCRQQPRAGAESVKDPKPTQQQQQPPSAGLYANCGGGGSQFYATHYEQTYANMAEANGINQAKEAAAGKTKLVSDKQTYARVNSQPRQAETNNNNLAAFYQQNGNQKLAQIDELANGLPTVDQLNANKAAANRDRKRMGASPSSQQVPSQHHHRGSPLSSSPVSSRTSSNISPSSEASTSSTSSLSAAGAPLARSSLRHTTTELGKRQFSVERDLCGGTPLTATLSRVGSCRGPAQGLQQVPAYVASTSSSRLSPLGRHDQRGPAAAEASPQAMSMMRNPLKSQQPPMRTSKILNIGSQQTNNCAPLPLNSNSSNQAQTASTTTTTNPAQMMPKNVSPGDSLSRLANNLANIKLSDNLAFSSLRAPKKSMSGPNLNASLNMTTSRHPGGDGTTNGRVSSTSSSPDKARLMKSAVPHNRQATTSTTTANNNNNGPAGGKSSVWFEYGCI